MQHDGRLRGPLYVQFVMGVTNAMPSDEPILDFYIQILKRLSPKVLSEKLLLSRHRRPASLRT